MIVNTFWGTKFNQEQTWTESGMRLPVTIIRTLPMTVSQIKTQDKDGYQAIQLGTEDNKRPAKPQAGHFKASKVSPFFRFTSATNRHLSFVIRMNNIRNERITLFLPCKV